METNRRFEAISLSFNIGIRNEVGKIGDIGDQMDCNPGGSVICDPGTGGCGAGAMSCVGSSCGGSSATRELNFDARILVDREHLRTLQKELQQVVAKFTR